MPLRPLLFRCPQHAIACTCAAPVHVRCCAPSRWAIAWGAMPVVVHPPSSAIRQLHVGLPRLFTCCAALLPAALCYAGHLSGPAHAERRHAAPGPPALALQAKVPLLREQGALQPMSRCRGGGPGGAGPLCSREAPRRPGGGLHPGGSVPGGLVGDTLVLPEHV